MPWESGWYRGPVGSSQTEATEHARLEYEMTKSKTPPSSVRFEKVDQKVSFPTLETQLQKKWSDEKTFQQSLKIREGRPRFVFYEGPPTANGKPGTHHILARSFKDLFGRYKTMKGLYVERKAGWDTHGLPVELEVEKQLHISGKFDIENEIGVERFNKLCRESVYRYVDEWTAFSRRMAFWSSVSVMLSRSSWSLPSRSERTMASSTVRELS